MRRITMLLVTAFLITSALGASGEKEAEPGYNPNWSIGELAHAQKIPVRKLVRELDQSLEAARGKSLGQLGIGEEAVEKAIVRYRTGEKVLVANIIFVGMAIVFASLVVVAFLIGLLRHIHFFERRSKSADSGARSVGTVIGTITSSGDLSDYSIAAVVAAIFLHEQEVEAENRLLLTWRRASVNQWKTGNPMPNSSLFISKGWRP